MSGAMLQLVAHNNNMGVNNFFSCEYNQLFFENNQHMSILRYGDTCAFKYLILKTQNEMSSTEFINSLDNSTFKLDIGGSTILLNPIILYTKLNPIIQIDSNTFCIEIPWGKFNDDLQIIALQYHDVRCMIQLSNQNIISESSLIVEYKQHDSDQRRQMAQSAHKKPVQLFESHIINLNQPTTQVISRLNFRLLSKGIIIDTDINNINNIKLTFNGCIRWNYNKLMIRLLSKNIGSNLYYIPFDSNIDFISKDINLFRSGANFSRIDTVVMTIDFENPVQNFSLHSLFLNYLIYQSGMGGLSFATGSPNDFQTENYIPYNKNTKNIVNKIIWKYVDKLLDECRGIICPISYDEIKLNDKYCTCDICKYNFTSTIFKDYIENTNNKKCSMCRSDWTNWTIYTNKEPNITS
jgi:hypothetical protein